MRRLEHRGGLGRFRVDVFSSIGRDGIGILVDTLYDGIESDVDLRPKFSRDLAGERERVKAFWEEQLGGEPRYSQIYGPRSMASIHEHIHISAHDAGRWLGHFRAGLRKALADPALINSVMTLVNGFARSLVNEEERCTSKNEQRCFRTKRSDQAVSSAARGEIEEVLSFLEDGRSPHPRLLVAAAQRGRDDVVSALLENGASVNLAALHESLYVTPLAVALKKKKHATVELLCAHGAKLDIFTAVFIGDSGLIDEEVTRDPNIVNARDPASDFAVMTPLWHAAVCDQKAAFLRLLDLGAVAAPLDAHLIKILANRRAFDLVERLLDAGARAEHLGYARWVERDDLAERLIGLGADVERAATPFQSWIWQVCTGNHGQQDEPELVRAILRHGGDPNAKRDDKSALHYAAAAGFVSSMSVLLESGADPNAEDSEGQTPLFSALRDNKKKDRVATVRCLLGAGADSTIRDRLGKGLVDHLHRSTGADRSRLLDLLM
ncbi:MAG: ankyrin repeat domain-containing protein [Deltaproteobacteria bacterium]|nr:ankyrin repeat domain-containing protein [Deltaproteobacteria bacterium]